jgi:sugar phosphate permease
MPPKDADVVMGLLGGMAAVVGSLTAGWLSDRLAERDPRGRLRVPIFGCCARRSA